MQINVHVTFNY